METILNEPDSRSRPQDGPAGTDAQAHDRPGVDSARVRSPPRSAGRHRSRPRVGRGVSRVARIAALVVLLTTVGVADASGDGQFVTRSGSRLMLNGSTFRFTGLNVWNAAGSAAGGRYCGDSTDLNVAAPSLGAGVGVVRVWFFQRLATTPGGQRDWSAFDQAVEAAREHGLKVVAVLGNQWADCEGYPTAATGYKSEAWYSGGYREVRPPGLPATYREWVREVVTRYRDNPTIMLWQMMNEAEDAQSLEGPCEPAAARHLRDFASDISGLIKQHDRHHLVSVGTAGSGQCGTSRGDYQALYAIPTVDVAEYHDYSPEPIPGDRWNGLAERLRQANELDKPLMVGEMGVVADQAGGLRGRAVLVRRKLEAQFAAGVCGALLWAWRAGSAGGSNPHGYEIGPRDPVLAQLADVARLLGAHQVDRSP